VIVEKISAARQAEATARYMVQEHAAVLIPAPCFCRGYDERHYHTTDPHRGSVVCETDAERWCAILWWARELKRQAEAKAEEAWRTR
jgi:hypothetical protein